MGVIGTMVSFLRWRFRRAGLKSVTIDTPLASVGAWVGGSGPPLLLLHGFGANALWCWHPQVRALARKYTLLVPDLPYFGRTYRHEAAYALGDQADVIHCFLDAMNVGRTHAVGISYGGLVLQAMHHLDPERFDRLVLVDSPGPTYSEEDHKGMLRRFGAPSIDSIIVPDHPADVRRLIELAWYRPPPTPSWLLRAVHAHMFCDRTEEKRELLRALDTLRADQDRPSQTLPEGTHILWGSDDPLFPASVARRLADSIPGSHLTILPRTRHAPNLERVGAFNRCVLQALGN